jgi:hypothetical protein
MQTGTALGYSYKDRSNDNKGSGFFSLEATPPLEVLLSYIAKSPCSICTEGTSPIIIGIEIFIYNGGVWQPITMDREIW